MDYIITSFNHDKNRFIKHDQGVELESFASSFDILLYLKKVKRNSISS